MMITAALVVFSFFCEWIPSTVASFPYPRLAQQAQIQGTVQLEVIIGPDGSPTRVVVRAGPKVLTDAAAEAVKNWKFVETCGTDSSSRQSLDVIVRFRLTEITREVPRQSFVYLYPRAVLVSSEIPHWTP